VSDQVQDEATILRVENLSHSFGEGEGRVRALRGVSFAAKAGQVTAVVGPSGCGKSTLLNIIGTLDQPTTGKVTLDGQDLNTLNGNALAALRNRKIGFIFQSHHLLPQCTVMENVLVPTLAHGQATATDEERGQRLLERVDLGERLAHRPGQLSGGERQRVAVVRALINQPKLLLADEPTGALDQATADKLGQLLVELNQEENVTLITVTHSGNLANRMARTLELLDGQLA